MMILMIIIIISIVILMIMIIIVIMIIVIIIMIMIILLIILILAILVVIIIGSAWRSNATPRIPDAEREVFVYTRERGAGRNGSRGVGHPAQGGPLESSGIWWPRIVPMARGYLSEV